MNNRRNTGYWPRAIEAACRNAMDQFPVLMVTGPRQLPLTRDVEMLPIGWP